MFLALGECWTLFSNLSRLFPPGLQGFFAGIHQPVLPEYQRGTLFSSLECSVYTAPPLCCLALWTPPHLASWLSASSPSLRFSFPAPKPGNGPKTASWSNRKAYLTCFLSLRDCCLLLSSVLKTVVFYIYLVCFLFFVYFRQEGKFNHCIFISSKSGNLPVSASYHRFLGSRLGRASYCWRRAGTLVEFFWEEKKLTNSHPCAHLTNSLQPLGSTERRPPSASGLQKKTESGGEGESSDGCEPSKMTARLRGIGAKISHWTKADMASPLCAFLNDGKVRQEDEHPPPSKTHNSMFHIIE